MKNNHNPCFIIVGGYISTGSSAVVDLLKEIECCVAVEAEIRFIKDPYGLIELRNSLTNRTDLICSSNAVWDFLDASKKWSRTGNHFYSRAGMSYKKKISSNYLKITKKFVNELCDFKYISDTYSDGFKKPYIKYVFDRIFRYLDKKTKKSFNLSNMHVRKDYFYNGDQDNFDKICKKYIQSLFEKQSYSKFIVLDQALTPADYLEAGHFFNNYKMIAVERDPRDVFIDCYFGTDFITKEPNSIEFAKKFVEIFKYLRKEKIHDSKSYLSVQFEELIFNYEKTVNRILSFLEIDSHEHSEKNKYFNPEISIKNVGLWKKYKNRFDVALDYIEKELKDYLYE